MLMSFRCDAKVSNVGGASGRRAPLVRRGPVGNPSQYQNMRTPEPPPFGSGRTRWKCGRRRKPLSASAGSSPSGRECCLAIDRCSALLETGDQILPERRGVPKRIEPAYEERAHAEAVVFQHRLRDLFRRADEA